MANKKLELVNIFQLIMAGLIAANIILSVVLTTIIVNPFYFGVGLFLVAAVPYTASIVLNVVAYRKSKFLFCIIKFICAFSAILLEWGVMKILFHEPPKSWDAFLVARAILLIAISISLFVFEYKNTKKIGSIINVGVREKHLNIFYFLT